MSAPLVELEWPEPLQRYVIQGTQRLRLTSHAPRRSIGFWLSILFGLIMFMAVIIGLFEEPLSSTTLPPTLIALVLGSMVFISVAYSAWGAVEIERHDTHWVVTRKLGKWAQSIEFDQEWISSVEIDSPIQYGSYLPDSAGQQVYVFINGMDDPFKVGTGLFLNEEVLQTLRQLLEPADRGPTESG